MLKQIRIKWLVLFFMVVMGCVSKNVKNERTKGSDVQEREQLISPNVMDVIETQSGGENTLQVEGTIDSSGGDVIGSDAKIIQEMLPKLKPWLRVALHRIKETLKYTPAAFDPKIIRLVEGLGDESFHKIVETISITLTNNSCDQGGQEKDSKITKDRKMCLSVGRLKKLPPEALRPQLIALFAHEYSHLLSYNENEATEIQQWFLDNGGIVFAQGKEGRIDPHYVTGDDFFETYLYLINLNAKLYYFIDAIIGKKDISEVCKFHHSLVSEHTHLSHKSENLWLHPALNKSIDGIRIEYAPSYLTIRDYCEDPLQPDSMVNVLKEAENLIANIESVGQMVKDYENYEEKSYALHSLDAKFLIAATLPFEMKKISAPTTNFSDQIDCRLEFDGSGKDFTLSNLVDLEDGLESKYEMKIALNNKPYLMKLTALKSNSQSWVKFLLSFDEEVVKPHDDSWYLDAINFLNAYLTTNYYDIENQYIGAILQKDAVEQFNASFRISISGEVGEKLSNLVDQFF